MIVLNPTSHLDLLINAKRAALVQRKQRTPIEAIRALASMQKRPQPVLSTITDEAYLQVFGFITYHANYDPVALAINFARAGVDGMIMHSDVLVDGILYTRGINDQTLVTNAVKPPLISSDYVLDEYHVVEARAAGASAVMLRPRTLSPESLRALVSLAQRNRLTVIIEVSNEEELSEALNLSPQVIALDTGVDGGFDALAALRAAVPSSMRVLLLCPLDTLESVQAAIALRPDAVVIGERFLSLPNAQEALAMLRRR